MALDNQTTREGDSGFIGMASRLNPLQLKEGMVQLAENMRLDRGVAQTRKGAKRLADAIAAGETELVLDFTLGTDISVTSITRSGSTATVTTASPHGETVGQIANIRGAAQAEYNGDFAVGSVPTSTTFTITVSGTPATPATGTITFNGGPVVRSTYSGGVFAAGLYSSPRLDDSNEYIVLAGPDAAYLWRDGASLVTKSYSTSPIAEQILAGDDVSIIQAFDRLYLLRGRDEPEYRLSALTQGFSNLASSTLASTGTQVTATLSNHGLIAGQQLVIAGKVGVDSVLNGSWSVASVLTGSTFTFNISNAPTTSALSVSSLTYALSGSTPTATATCSGHPFQAGNVVTISGATPSGYNLTATVTATTSTTFSYVVGGTLTSPATGTITATPSLSPTVISAATGTATATTPTPHGYTAGQVVRIYGSDQAGYNADFLIASVPTTTTFTFAVPTGTVTPSTGVAFARRVCAPLVWDGGTGNFVRVGLGSHPAGPTFSRMPSASIVTYTNNTLLMARNRDEVIISDVLDAETYDPLLKSFRANAGSNDQIVALHPYAEGQVLVFCRKSIWLATAVMGADGISIDPANSSLQLLTNEVGCSARRSIATAGVYVYFLSDSGIYRLDNQFDLKLRGNTKPLSDPIADLLSDINVPAVGLSNGVFFNNRYYLAVPTKLANGLPSDTPNTLFIYNMLNEAWESRDFYAFNLDNLLVSDYGTERRLYAASRNGKLYLLDQYDSGLDDQPSGSGSYTVAGRLVTRRYGFGSLTRKRLTRTVSSVVLPAGASAAMDAITTDPDGDFEILSLTNSGNSLEDYTVKGPIRRNANLLDLRWRTKSGRPILRAITAEATVDGLPKTGTRTEE